MKVFTRQRNKRDAGSLGDRVRRQLAKGGLRGQVFRVYRPEHSEGYAEVLLVGVDGEPYTVYLGPGIDDPGERIVQVGW